MRKTILGMLAALLITSPAAAHEWSVALKNIDKKVPRLAMQRGEDSGTCSAVVINEDPAIAVTAAHCVGNRDDKEIDLTLNEHHAEVIKVNKVLDLALIKFSHHDEVAVALAKRSAEQGQAIVVAGYPFGVENIGVQFGHVAISKEGKSKLMWLNVDLIFGDSGGAVLDSDGELVGINSGVFARGPAHMGTAVPIEKVRDFVEDFLPKEKK